MSEKCQMPAGSVRCISLAEMVSPGKRVRVTLVVQGQHLLVTLNKTIMNALEWM